MTVVVRYSSELYHHGIKGQKHGVRRYQNEDGSLTPAGRVRYGVGEKQNRAFTSDEMAGMERTRKDRIAYNKLQNRELRRIARGHTSALSDRELERAKDRIRLEAEAKENSNRLRRAKVEKRQNAMDATAKYLLATGALVSAGSALYKNVRNAKKTVAQSNNDQNQNENKNQDQDQNNEGKSPAHVHEGFEYNVNRAKTINRYPFIDIKIGSGGNKQQKQQGQNNGGEKKKKRERKIFKRKKKGGEQ